MQCTSRGRMFSISARLVMAGYEMEKTLEVSCPVVCVAFRPDSRWLVAGCRDKNIAVWDTKKGFERIKTLEGHTATVNAICISNEWIVSGSHDNTIRVWTTKGSCRCKKTLEGHQGPISTLAFSADNRWIVSGSEDRTLHIWM